MSTGAEHLVESVARARVPVLAVGLDGTVLALSPPAQALVGDVAGTALAALADGADLEAAVGDAQVDLRRADGSTAPAHLAWTTAGADGPAYRHVVVLDQAEAHGPGRWEALLAHATDVGWTAHEDGTIIDATPSVRHQLGWATEDVRGTCAFDYVHPDDRARFRQVWEALVAGHARQAVVECRVKDVDGGWHWVRDTLADLRDDPRVGAMLGNVVDISEWREDLEARRRFERQFRARFEQAQVPQATLDERGAFVAVNPALCRLVGKEPAALLGRKVSELNHDHDPGHADRTLAEVLAGQPDAAQVERVVAHDEGSPVPVHADLNALRDEHGRLDGVALFWHDLTGLHAVRQSQQRQQQVFEALSRRANDLALVLDPEGHVLYASPAVLDRLGYDQDDLNALSDWAFVHPDDLDDARRGFLAVVLEGGSRTFTVRVRDASGAWHWVEETVTNFLGTAVNGIVWNGRDVTEKVEAERAMRASEARYRAIADTGAEGIWAVGLSGRTLYVNQRMADITGLPLQELYEARATDLLDEEQADLMRRRVRHHAGAGVERFEVRYDHPDGTPRVLAIAATPLETADGEVEGSLAMVTDVTDARRAEHELRHAALHDALTGLPNRTLLLDRLERALTRESRGTAVMFVDVDHFKLVNDSRGHDVGDELLVAVAQRLLEAVRPTDTVARFGGDEFVVVYEHVDETEAREVAERLLEALTHPVQLSQGAVHVGASIGVAVSPPASAGDLLRFADTAMYSAKSQGRGRVQLFDRSLAEAAEEQYALAADLRLALAEDRLALHYQPVVDLGSGAVLGMEALARWDHPEHGAVPPTRFVELADVFGLSHELDSWVLCRALREADALRAAGRVPEGCYVAVNLSARNLADARLEDLMLSALEPTSLTPEHVLVEITESAIMDDTEQAIAVLGRLRARGFRVAVDDFGTGYSSLAYLRDLPITLLKVDRSFVARMTEDRDSLAIIASIVDLARAIGVAVVAEGVETTQQAALLRRLGCEAAQGWLWSRAVPPAQLSDGTRWNRPFAVPDPSTGKAPTGRQPWTPAREEHGLSRLVALQEEGASLETIASALNREGFRAPNGRRWHSSTVARAVAEALAAEPARSRRRG